MRKALFIFFLITISTTGYSDNFKTFEHVRSLLHQSTLKSKDSIVNVHDFSIIGDSITDYSEQIQKILTQYKQVYFPPGNYLISKSLVLQDGQVIMGSDHTNFIDDSNFGKKKFSFFLIKSKKNITISDVTFISRDIPERTVFAVLATNIAYLTMKKVHSYNCGIIKTQVDSQYNYKNIPAEFYTDAFDSISNAFIEIDSCYGVGSEKSISLHDAGVLFYFANDWKITHSTFIGYNHGIQWWGGDSHPERDGNIGNVRKCRNGLVSHVTVERIRGGGIWGSMGENIRVENCKVSDCGDVGIDFEGCFNSQAINNEVSHSRNGCLAIFHFNKDILFKNNRLVQKKPGYPLACIYNAAQKQDNGKVVFLENTFIATEKVGIIKQQGPSRHIEFLKNNLHNVVIDFSFNNNQYILIKENIIYITREVTHFNFIIKAGQTNNHGILEIEKNRIINVAQQREDFYVLHVFQGDYNSSPINRISENQVDNILNKIKIEWAGANSGITCRTYISNQSVSIPSIEKIDTGKKPSEIYINGKKKD